MERKHRLTRSIDFKRVRRTGKSHAHPLAVLISLRNDLAITRVGISAAKSIGKAVRRNRAKRRLREAMRLHLPDIASGWDVVVIAHHQLQRVLPGRELDGRLGLSAAEMQKAAGKASQILGRDVRGMIGR